MRYSYPAWPSDRNALFYHVPSFAAISLKEAAAELGASTKASDKTMPSLPIRLTSQTDGKNFCFSNEEWSNKDTGNLHYPKCTKAANDVTTHIKSIQNSNSGLHSVFVNAIQFNFKSTTDTNGDKFSKAIFENAYIEKANVSFNETTGLPVLSNKKGYNYGTGDCNIEDHGAVGFDVENQSSNRFLLSGLSSFERGHKLAFGEGSGSHYQATLCQDPSTQEMFLCNLNADKVSVWHSLLVPVLYKNRNTNALRIGHRQYPNQVVSNGQLIGSKGAALSHFGRYAAATAASLGNVVSTPAMGKVDRDGNEIPNWEQSFITKFCIKGKRRETDGAKTVDHPLIHAMHFELRSPRVFKTTNSN